MVRDYRSFADLFVLVATIDKFATIGSIQYGTNILGLVNLLNPLGLYDPVKAVCYSFSLRWTVERDTSVSDTRYETNMPNRPLFFE